MIFGTVGRGGSGKSLTTVQRLWRIHKKKGREVVSNTPLVDLRVYWHSGLKMWCPVDAESFGMSWASQYIKTFDEVRYLDNCEVFIDEAGTWMPAAKHSSMPEEMRAFIAQDRREGVNCWWTHRTTRVWVDLRENTAEITRCQRYGPLIWMKCTDPEEPKEVIHKFAWVKDQIYDLYQTFARVGSAVTGNGYGYGNRTGYKSGGASGNMTIVDISAWNPDHENLEVRVRPNQLEVLKRKFGLEHFGVEREVNGLGVKYKYPAKPVWSPGLLPSGPVQKSLYKGG